MDTVVRTGAGAESPTAALWPFFGLAAGGVLGYMLSPRLSWPGAFVGATVGAVLGVFVGNLGGATT